MFDVGLLELFIVATIALIVLGPDKLPAAARSAGLMIGKFRRTISDIQDDLERQARLDELKEKLRDPDTIFSDEQSNSNMDAEQEAKLDLQDSQSLELEQADSQESFTSENEFPARPKQIDSKKIAIQTASPKADD